MGKKIIGKVLEGVVIGIAGYIISGVLTNKLNKHGK